MEKLMVILLIVGLLINNELIWWLCGSFIFMLVLFNLVVEFNEWNERRKDLKRYDE